MKGHVGVDGSAMLQKQTNYALVPNKRGGLGVGYCPRIPISSPFICHNGVVKRGHPMRVCGTYGCPVAEQYSDTIHRTIQCRAHQTPSLPADSHVAGARLAYHFDDGRTRRSRRHAGVYEECISVVICVGRAARREPISDRVDVSPLRGEGDLYRENHVQCALVLRHTR